MSHPIIQAARVFLREEKARERASKRRRMRATRRDEVTAIVEAVTVRALTDPIAPVSVDDAAARGRAAIQLFGYDASLQEAAVSVIADIMHAIAAEGGRPDLRAQEAYGEWYAEHHAPRRAVAS